MIIQITQQEYKQDFSVLLKQYARLLQSLKEEQLAQKLREKAILVKK